MNLHSKLGPYTRQIGATIKSLREAHNMTSTEAAEHLGITQSYMSQLEQGRYKLGAETLKEIADMFGLSVSYLLGETEAGKNGNIRKLLGRSFAEAMLDSRFVALVGKLAKSHKHQEDDWLFEAAARLCNL